MYFAFIFVCFCAIAFPNIGFNAENWGKIIRTIAATNASESFELMFNVPRSVLSDFSPLEAFGYSFGLAYFVAVVLGLTILLFNLTLKHNIGLVVSGALVFVFMFVHMGGRYIMYYFSPLHWFSISFIDRNGISVYPDASWIISVLCMWLGLEIVALFVIGGKKIRFVLNTKEEVT